MVFYMIDTCSNIARLCKSALEIGNAVDGLDWDMISNSHVDDSSSSASVLQDISVFIQSQNILIDFISALYYSNNYTTLSRL
jgi:hypothetical protein